MANFLTMSSVCPESGSAIGDISCGAVRKLPRLDASSPTETVNRRCTALDNLAC
jgi:hypothetical protein